MNPSEIATVYKGKKLIQEIRLVEEEEQNK